MCRGLAPDRDLPGTIGRRASTYLTDLRNR